MKPSNMKTPPLSQIVSQRIGYAAHLKKLQQIRQQRKHNLLGEAKLLSKHSSFEHKFNERSMAIHKSNTQLMIKINKAKSIVPAAKSPIYTAERSLSSSSIYSNKIKIIEQEKENYRMRNRVKSVSSQLSSKSMQKQYSRSMQIKNRLMKYKSDCSGKVVLKTQKLLGNAYKNGQSRLTNILKGKKSQGFNQQIKDQNQEQIDNYTRRFLDSKLKPPYNYYKKEQILKNKVNNNFKMLKMARDRKMRSITMTEQQNAKPKLNQRQSEVRTGFFPTQIKKV